MFQKLIAFSLRQPTLVLLLAIAVLGAGIYQVLRLPIDVFPELNAPTVVVMTEAAGLSADEVEANVTVPIESSVNGLPGLRRVRSASAIGLSLVWAEFGWGEDLYRSRMLVSEKLSMVQANLPVGIHAAIAPISSITGEIMLLSLSSPDAQQSPMQLRSFAEFALRQRLLAIPGVAQVVAIGGDMPEYQVHVRQEQLRLLGLTMADVVHAAERAHTTAGAGYLAHVDGLELPVRQTGRVRSVADLASTLLRHQDGASLVLGQVADVALGGMPKRGAAGDRGQAAVVVSIQKAPGTNTLALTAAIDQELDRIAAALPAGMVLNRHVMRQAEFIERSIDNLVTVLRDAALFVAVILVLFLLSARTTLITLAALPLSLAVAFLALWLMGLTINVMTLGGLAVAIGELVDDAIIDVENVFRRLRENAALPAATRVPPLTVVWRASNEVRGSVVFATAIICMVFVPLLFLDGLEGRFFRPLGIAYIVATLASLVVALTVTPALCGVLLRDHAGRGHSRDSALVCWLKRHYQRALAWTMQRRKLVLAAAAAATVGALLLGRTFGTSFLPEFNEGSMTVFLMCPTGTSLSESDRLGQAVERQLAALPELRSVVRRTGRAERDEHAEPVSSSEIDVTLALGISRQQARAAIDHVLAKVPGITTSVGQPIEHRLSHVMSGTPAAIAIMVQGEDLAVLRSLAPRIEAVLRAIPGTRDVTANREIMIASLPVRYRAADLAAAGLTAAAAAEQVQTALAGRTVAEVSEGLRRIPITVSVHPQERDSLADLRNLLLTGAGGAQCKLSEVAEISKERASNLIAREAGQRKAVISCNVADGYNLGQLVEQVRTQLEPMVVAAGCNLTLGGQFAAQQSASRSILWMGGLVVALMFVLLRAAFASSRAAWLIMVNLPLSLIGGIAAVYLVSPTNPVVSIPTMVGFITLFGIAVRNGILLVRHYLDLLRAGATLDEAVQRGSMERLVPILMTALTAALGLLPVVMAIGEPGSEILAPLSVVVLGGLLTSTLLNLLLVPAGFSLLFRGAASRATLANVDPLLPQS